MELAGKAALITGARRLGHVVAQALAARGVDVAVSYRQSKTEAEATVAEVVRLGRRGAAIAADLSHETDCARLVDACVAELGRLDILVNMASLYRPVAFDELTASAWHDDLAVNLTATYLCSLAAVPHMRRAGGGRIVNFSDWLAASGRPLYLGFVPYYVAKRGVMALTEAMALELAGDQILVNAIAPGPIEAPPDLSGAEVAEVAALTPVGRWGGAETIAATVVALVESDFITGETVRVDGGRHLK
jgi:NAD(P)-dependent dehydrogenase (short-subunit alcohol dehydrogenase family)